MVASRSAECSRNCATVSRDAACRCRSWAKRLLVHLSLSACTRASCALCVPSSSARRENSPPRLTIGSDGVPRSSSLQSGNLRHAGFTFFARANPGAFDGSQRSKGAVLIELSFFSLAELSLCGSSHHGAAKAARRGLVLRRNSCTTTLARRRPLGASSPARVAGHLDPPLLRVGGGGGHGRAVARAQVLDDATDAGALQIDDEESFRGKKPPAERPAAARSSSASSPRSSPPRSSARSSCIPSGPGWRPPRLRSTSSRSEAHFFASIFIKAQAIFCGDVAATQGTAQNRRHRGQTLRGLRLARHGRSGGARRLTR